MNKEQIETRTKELEAAIQLMRRNTQHFGKMGGIKNSERHFLWILYSLSRESGRVNPTDIAKKIGVTMSAITHLINSLETAGLVRRVPDETDRRVVLLELTPAGKLKVEAVKKQYWQKFAKLVEYLGDADSAKIIEIITKISRFDPTLTD